MIRIMSSFTEPPLFLACIMALAAVTGAAAGARIPRTVPAGPASPDLRRFLVLDPGHFHAALVFQRPSYEGISSEVSVYAPSARISPTTWRGSFPSHKRGKPGEVDIPRLSGTGLRAGDAPGKPGSIAILSGRNDGKIERIIACANAGFHVLADKPWIIDHASFALLDSALFDAERKKVVIYDIMTERHEITTILQRRIIADETVFGTLEKGTPSDPAVTKKSVHHIAKVVAGKPLKRPGWFFDTAVQGEGLVDVTTHLVDLVFWTLFPEKAIDWRNDISMFSASRWPTVLTPDEFGRVTGLTGFPKSFALDEKGNLPYYCNGQMIFKVNGVSSFVQVEWKYEAPPGGGDTHYSLVRGTKARVIVRQEKEQNYRPELYIEPAPGTDRAAVGTALAACISGLAAKEFPGIAVVEERGRWRIDIPQTYRVGHEAHFRPGDRTVPEVCERRAHARLGTAQYAREILCHHESARNGGNEIAYRLKLSEPVMRVINLMKDDGIQGTTSAVIMLYHTHHRFRRSL